MNQKGLAPILVLVIVLIAGIVGGGYYLYKSSLSSVPSVQNTVKQPTPTPDNATNWKTYTNTKYGFAFKYPENWKVTREEENKITFQLLVQLDQANPKTLYNFTVIVPQEDFDSLKNELVNITNQYKGSVTLFRINNEITDAQKANYVTGANSSDYVLTIIFRKNNVPINIQASFINPPNEEELTQFNNILSTFKFLPALPTSGDQNQTGDTSNWKTYTSRNYSFKYPETWIIKNTINEVDNQTTLYILSPDFIPDPNYEDFHEGGNLVGAKSGSRLEVETEVNPVLKTYEDVKKFYESTATKNWNGMEFNNKKEININGVKTMLHTGGKPDGQGLLSEAYFVVSQRRYSIALISSQNKDNLFTQILSTFKFTN